MMEPWCRDGVWGRLILGVLGTIAAVGYRRFRDDPIIKLGKVDGPADAT